MKITKEKVQKFLSGKGFYLVLAAGLLAVGVASAVSYLEYNKIKEPVGENLSSESSLIISSTEESSSEIEAGTDTKEPYDSSEVSSEEALDIVADSFDFPVLGEVIKGFSLDELQFSATYNDMRTHQAIDITAEPNEAVVSAGKGVVTDITKDSELGMVVEIDHGNGIIAYYCGLSEEVAVAKGEAVDKSTLIGFAGEVPGECEDEPHIHLEVYKNGKPIDPKSLIN